MDEDNSFWTNFGSFFHSLENAYSTYTGGQVAQTNAQANANANAANGTAAVVEAQNKKWLYIGATVVGGLILWRVLAKR